MSLMLLLMGIVVVNNVGVVVVLVAVVVELLLVLSLVVLLLALLLFLLSSSLRLQVPMILSLCQLGLITWAYTLCMLILSKTVYSVLRVLQLQASRNIQPSHQRLLRP